MIILKSYIRNYTHKDDFVRVYLDFWFQDVWGKSDENISRTCGMSTYALYTYLHHKTQHRHVSICEQKLFVAMHAQFIVNMCNAVTPLLCIRNVTTHFSDNSEDSGVSP